MKSLSQKYTYLITGHLNKCYNVSHTYYNVVTHFLYCKSR